MNKLKRIGAFLLAFVMCLQVITFSAFAESLDWNGLNTSLDAISDFGILTTDFIDEMNSYLDDEYKLNIIQRDNLYVSVKENINIGFAADSKTDNLKAIYISFKLTDALIDDDYSIIDHLGEYLTTSIFILADYEFSDSFSDDFLEADMFNFLTQKRSSFTYKDVLLSKKVTGNTVSYLIISNVPKEQSKTQQPEQKPQTLPEPKNDTISVVIDGQPLVTNVAPQSINGRTMVPVRGIFEALGATVTWNADTKQVVATKENKKVTLTLNSTTAYIDGEAKTLESPAISYNGSTLVPARFVAEAFGAAVTWDNATKTVNIVTTTPETNTVQPQTTQTITSNNTPKGDTVYVTKTGKKYHYDSSCNGGKYYESTLQEAESRGLTPCDKCA